MPIIKLGGSEKIHVSFDELSHEYRRYTYNLTHLEHDWTDSYGLMSSDYISGERVGLIIDDYEESINTTQNYTHYHLQLPNADCRIRLSGNYRLDIFDDNSDTPDSPVITAYFMVNEDKLNASIGYTTDTDIDVRRSHQQAEVKVDYKGVQATSPRTQIKGYVLQNNSWDNAVKLPQSTSINQQYMEWTHCRPLIFDGDNEYHKFEILDIHRNSFNVENNTWDAKQQIWHTYVWPDYKRYSYVYDETPKGSFYIRNSDNSENNTTSEYVIVHFTLQAEEPFPYPVYVDGTWSTIYANNPDRYLMTYDKMSKAYMCEIPLKYGYYSYHYVMKKNITDRNGNTSTKYLIPPTEGSFYETANNYTVLFYYRGNIDRTDRLVGVASFSKSNNRR